jgi:hypothetical protein
VRRIVAAALSLESPCPLRGPAQARQSRELCCQADATLGAGGDQFRSSRNAALRLRVAGLLLAGECDSPAIGVVAPLQARGSDSPPAASTGRSGQAEGSRKPFSRVGEHPLVPRGSRLTVAAAVHLILGLGEPPNERPARVAGLASREQRKPDTDDYPRRIASFTSCPRGGAGPPLVLIHGFVDCWRTWDLVLPHLERPTTCSRRRSSATGAGLRSTAR